jgi:ribonuclease P protein component
VAIGLRGENGLGPERRLKRRRDFLRLQGRGDRRYGRRFIYYFRGSPTGETRIGITVSKKVGGAVTRNRIKRWVREVFRHHPEVFERPVDLVLIAKRDVDDFSFAHIEEEFTYVVPRYFRASEPPARRGRHDPSRSGGGND